MDASLTLAFRALRHPLTGMATLVARASTEMDASVVAAYLIRPSGTMELLGAGGPAAATAGSPGPVSPELGSILRGYAREAHAACAPPPEGSPAPLGAHAQVCTVCTQLPDGPACLVVAAGAEPLDRAVLERLAGPMALLAALLITGREVDALRRELHRIRQDHTLVMAGLQHDLRAPLTSIIGATGTVREIGDQLSERERDELLRMIADQAERLNAMIEDTLSKDARGPDSPVLLRPADVSAIVRRAVAAARYAREGELRMDVPEAIVVTDAERVERCLLNLLDNALKYAPADGAVHVVGEHTAGGVDLTVADAGPGVPSALVPTLFSPYATDQEREGGFGLGLYSASRIIGEIGGRVSYSRRDGWTRFTLHLPDRPARVPTDHDDEARAEANR
jgi:K+-sensing histidine kinase KdpD